MWKDRLIVYLMVSQIWLDIDQTIVVKSQNMSDFVGNLSEREMMSEEFLMRYFPEYLDKDRVEVNESENHSNILNVTTRVDVTNIYSDTTHYPMVDTNISTDLVPELFEMTSGKNNITTSTEHFKGNISSNINMKRDFNSSLHTPTGKRIKFNSGRVPENVRKYFHGRRKTKPNKSTTTTEIYSGNEDLPNHRVPFSDTDEGSQPDDLEENYYEKEEEINSSTEKTRIQRKKVLIEKKNELYEEDKVISRASHGIHLLEQGEAYVFEDYWEQFIKIKLLEEPLKENVKNFSNHWCKEFVNKMIVKEEAGRIALFQYAYCNNKDYFYDQLVENMENISTEAYKQFQGEYLTRRKRAVGIGIGAIIGFVAGVAVGGVVGHHIGWYAGSRHTMEKMLPKLEKLENQLSDLNEASAFMEKSLVGLTKTLEEQDRETQKKFKLMEDTTKHQFEIFDSEFEKLRDNYDELEIDAQVNKYNILNLIKMQNILMLELDRFKILEKIMISLKKGLLPKALIGVEKLKSILNNIRINLGNNYDLAIENENWAYYYDFPLVSHIVTQENGSHYIYLHLKVPLRQKDKLSRYELITPHFQAFPCMGNCFDKYPDKEQLLVLKYPQHSWLYNPISREVDFEVNLDHMSCKETNNKRLCYTFYTSLLSASTKCT